MPLKPYIRRGSSLFWGRLPTPTGRRSRTLGSRDLRTARAILHAVESLSETPRWRSLAHRCGQGELAASELYEAYQRSTLEALEKRLSSPDVDLEPLVEKWHQWLVAQSDVRPNTSDKYRSQVRRLIPEGTPFLLADFSRQRIRDFLDEMSGEIRATNRYRAALSRFAGWLVERGVLEQNPVRSVSGKKEAPPRATHLEHTQAQRLVNSIAPDEARAMHALMCGSGLEVGATLALTHQDIVRAKREVHAHGTKTEWRDRRVRVTTDWCWEIVECWLDDHPGLPNAPIFRLKYAALRSALHEALKACEMGASSYHTHDWRHTYAVQALRDGYPPQLVAHQLGHKDSTMVLKVYGKYAPNDADYDRLMTKRVTITTDALAEYPTFMRAI